MSIDSHPNIHLFVKQVIHIKSMVLSHSVPELIEKTRTAIKNVLKAEKADFLLMDRELIVQHKESRGQT